MLNFLRNYSSSLFVMLGNLQNKEKFISSLEENRCQVPSQLIHWIFDGLSHILMSMDLDGFLFVWMITVESAGYTH